MRTFKYGDLQQKLWICVKSVFHQHNSNIMSHNREQPSRLLLPCLISCMKDSESRCQFLVLHSMTLFMWLLDAKEIVFSRMWNIEFPIRASWIIYPFIFQVLLQCGDLQKNYGQKRMLLDHLFEKYPEFFQSSILGE